MRKKAKLEKSEKVHGLRVRATASFAYLFVFTLLFAPDFILAKTGSQLSHYDLSAKKPNIIVLSKELNEISGIAFSPDGRLFCHDDERGIVFELDKVTGKITKRFYLGEKNIKGDFESIAIADKTFYLCRSDGIIFEFSEAKDDGRALYNTYETGLAKENDVEGMCYDPETKSLLLACKGYPGDGYDKGVKTVYSFDLTKGKLHKKPRFVLDMKKIAAKFGLIGTDIHPSEIALNPISHTFFVLNHKGKAIIEISREGKIIDAVNIPASIHNQPEGLCFASDGTMYISNEGGEGRATLVIYPLKK